MRAKTFQRLRAGDLIRTRRNGTTREILRCGKYTITLKQIGYSYLGHPKPNGTVTYCVGDCKPMIVVRKNKLLHLLP